MSFATFTRPGGSKIEVNTADIVSFSAVPTSGPLVGPSLTGTRLDFGGGSYQDVLETVPQVERILASK